MSVGNNIRSNIVDPHTKINGRYRTKNDPTWKECTIVLDNESGDLVGIDGLSQKQNDYATHLSIENEKTIPKLSMNQKNTILPPLEEIHVMGRIVTFNISVTLNKSLYSFKELQKLNIEGKVNFLYCIQVGVREIYIPSTITEMTCNSNPNLEYLNVGRDHPNGKQYFMLNVLSNRGGLKNIELPMDINTVHLSTSNRINITNMDEVMNSDNQFNIRLINDGSN